jgi:glycosyltransferase involved in cell wall biosynthesis
MIVRDEAANIGLAMASLSGVHEIIVVDTGSTDGTPELAASAGAKVVRMAWNDDFAAARNESLRHATGAWIVYVDADEELVEPRPGELRRLCSSLGTKEAGAYLTIRNPVDEQELDEVRGEQWRLFRNVPGLRFEGRIHEQLRWPSGLPSIRHAGGGSVWIRHRGYVNDPQVIQRKGERNRRLLALSVAEEPEHPAHQFFLGRQHAWERQFDKALPILERAIAIWSAGGRPAEGYVPSMFATAALAALRTSQSGKVLEIAAATPEAFVSAELLFVAGVACAALGKTDEATERLNRAWQDRSLAQASGSDPSTSSWRPLLALSEIYEALGRLEDARAAVEKALELAPGRKDLEHALERLVSPTRPLISACMIVRNEADNLRSWLPALRSAVDELIVVDTGSTDATAEVARSLGASVHHFDWRDDFAAARNESLKYATGQWILWQDADDQVIEATPGALRMLCRSLALDVHGCWVNVDSPSSAQGNAATSLRQWRLFRNGLGIHFRGRVHEQPSAPPEFGAIQLLDQNQVRVKHWGYTGDGALMAAKLERNRKLLELSITEEPSEPMHHYSLGKQYVLERDFTAAAGALDLAMSLWQAQGQPAYGYVAPMFSVAACAALNLGLNERVLELEAGCPPTSVASDLLYCSAIASQRLGRPDGAIARLMRAASDPAVRTATETDPATATWQPRLLLGQILTQLNRQQEAYDWIVEALDLMPDDHADVLLGGARMALALGHDADAERVAQRVFAGPAAATIKMAARALLDDVSLRRKPVPA